MKMYGGGMGDQIKRYCEKMEPEDYEDILDNEARVSDGEQFDKDPNCVETKDRGRQVTICRSGNTKLGTSSSSKLSIFSDAPLINATLASKLLLLPSGR